jgi:hypothetical protein
MMKANTIYLDRFVENFINDEELLEYLDGDRAVECLCPRCGVHHLMFLFWTGRGMPRKFCPLCKGNTERIAPEQTVAIPGSYRIQMEQAA